ncbi:Nif11-like leader peptide family natural product precursor [Spirulina major]|jgi:hypothetical protein|uniref:Nif11-like leader peptide family natural product precursor n=1 Tax=Spirulina major TaxID=270636 RepID=UPI000934B511|nr:Nif11-like leader peptide family natural product precursor [Spirulina major]
MSRRNDVIRFFQQVCDDPALQDQLKPPCEATRHGFARIAQASGYSIDGADIDNYVRFVQFYGECQQAIARHQDGQEPLARWLNDWQKHLKRFEENPLDDRHDTIKRFL